MAGRCLYLKATQIYFLLWMYYTSVSCADLQSCSAVKSEYSRQGFTDEVPEYPIAGDHLKFCNSGSSISQQSTCCTKEMEHKLSVQSREDFDTKLKKILNPFASLLDKKHKKFDELFLNLLNQSQRSFDEMFTRTYGVIYKQNAYFFVDLFQSLQDYYTKGNKDMQTEMDNFFRKLYEKMFTVFNSQYLFDDNYLKCVHSHMDELKPFGNDPKELTTNIKRSFVAFRTFVQGIATAASVIRNVPLEVNPSADCLPELMKMTHCGTCDGHQGTKPCLPYCLNVQQLCLAHHLPLAELWIKFIDAMEKLGDRLETSFNIGHVVQPINLKISNAVMNFQESGNAITEKIFHGCGTAHLKGRPQRSARGREVPLESLNFNAPEKHAGDPRSHGEAITKLIREIKTKIKNSHDLWPNLPSDMCKEARRHGAAKCWTGSSLGKYEGDSLLNLSDPVHSPQMDEQIFRLKVITNKLVEAFHGRDVSWIDDEWLKKPDRGRQDDEGYEGSGGSGWVYSSNVDNHGNKYPIDDEDGNEMNYHEGSGHGGQGYPEGSGDYMAPPPIYDTGRPRDRGPENPTSSVAEKPMTLTWAVAVYLLPAVFAFLGSIG